MKKTVIPILLAISLLLSLCAMSGCGKKFDGEINVYNFGEYIDESTYKDFEKEFNIKVNYNTYETCEQLYSIIKTGGADYDVIITSDYMVARMADEGMLQELDFNHISNYSLIGKNYRNPGYDPDGLYSVPYMWGTVGIIWNPTLVDEEITSWRTMFDEKYAGQILMFESTRDAFAVALSYLGYSLNTTDEAEINEAYELLERQKPLVQGYFQDQQYDKLEGSEAAIGVYYAGDYLCMLENNPDLKFVVPEEGSNWFVDAMCVPSGSAKKALAEEFINYMCRTDVTLTNMEATGYASPNAEAAEQCAADLDEWYYSVMFPDDGVIGRCEVYSNLPQETLDLYDSLWIKLKA